MLFGRRPVLEALSGGTPLRRLLIAQDYRGEVIERIISQARELKVKVEWVPRHHIETLFPGRVHQGVAAEILVRAGLTDSFESFVTRIHESPVSPFLLILDGITDPRNLGALIRTANAAGAQGVIIPLHRAAGLTPVVEKASAGATAYTPVIRVANCVQACKALKEKGFWIAGADIGGKGLWYEVDFTMPVALVLGSEGKGMRRLLKEQCDILVRLPMLGRISSLNVSVAGGILMYELLRQRMLQNPSYPRACL